VVGGLWNQAYGAYPRPKGRGFAPVFHVKQPLREVVTRLPNAVTDPLVNYLNSSTEKQFVSQFFTTEDEYERYVEEFNSGSVKEERQDAIEELESFTGPKHTSIIDLTSAERIYALIRKQEPPIVVETGSVTVFLLCVFYKR